MYERKRKHFKFTVNGHSVRFVNSKQETSPYYVVYLLPSDKRFNHEWTGTKGTNKLILETLTLTEIMKRFSECTIKPPYKCIAYSRKTNKIHPEYRAIHNKIYKED